MKKPFSYGMVLTACALASPQLNAEEINSIINKQPLLLAAAQNEDDVPAGFHRMPDGTLMANQTTQSVTIDDLGGVLPEGYHIMQDGTVMANNPANAIAPKGYELQADGTLIAKNTKPKGATINDFGGIIPPSFHMMPDGTLMANDPNRSKAPDGYHIMPDGRLMAHGGSGNSHEHHSSGGHHGAGMWMFEYKYMRMAMENLKDANLVVEPGAIFYDPYNFDAAPTKMNMDMHMFMLMYGLTEKISLMGMFHYIVNDMEMLIDDATGETTNMHSSGIGDTILSGSMQIPHNMEMGFGVSLPTGSTSESGSMRMRMGDETPMTMNMLYPYAMQLGSGTIDIIPSLAYRNSWQSFDFGGKLAYTMRTKKSSDEYAYRLGNKLEVSAFTDWNLHKNISLNVTGTLLSWGKIEGKTNPALLHGPNGAGSPAAHPELYGGTRVDLSFGAKLKTSDQMYYVRPEFAIPIYQNLWGPQMRTSWIFSAAIGAMF